MPSMTITLTNGQWDRLKTAIQRYRDDEEHPGETDTDLAKRWLRLMGHNEVWRYERDQQGISATADWDMDVT